MCTGKSRGVLLENTGRRFIRKWYLILRHEGSEGTGLCLPVGLRVIRAEREPRSNVLW